MADKSAKKKRQKADQPGVLGSLPSTRPARLGRARPGSGEDRGTATAAKPQAATTTSSPRATKAQARSKRGTATPRPRAGTRPKAAGTKPRTATPREPGTPRSPEPDGRRATQPRGLELVTTGAQAAGELARIGLTVGGQVLKRAARRLPRS